MAILIWTSASAKHIRSVFSPVFSRTQIEHRVVSDMAQMPPLAAGDVLLACGTKALEALAVAGIAPKGRTVTSMRDGALAAKTGNKFVTFDPGMSEKDFTLVPEMQWDAMLAIRYHETRSLKPPPFQGRYVEHLSDLILTIDALYEKTREPVRVTVDLETLGLDEYNLNAWIIAASFTVHGNDPTQAGDVLYFEQGEAPVALADFDPDNTPELSELSYWEALWVQINWVLTTTKVITRGANFKYDSRWLRHKWGIEVTNFKFDTLLAGALLNENQSNSLKLHAKLYTPYGGYESDLKSVGDMSRLDLVPKHVLLPYVVGDTFTCYQVADHFVTELKKDARLARFYAKLLQPSSHVFEKMERKGVWVDRARYAKLNDMLTEELGRLDLEMKAMIPGRIKAKYLDDFKLSRAALLIDYLFTPMGLNLKPLMYTAKSTEEKKTPSTAMDHLMLFEDDPVASKFIGLLKQKTTAAKVQQTYVTGFLTHLRSDGRFHPSFYLARGEYATAGKDASTVTGRCLVGDSLVLTKRGSIPIVDVVVGDFVWTHKSRWRKVTAVYNNGVKPVVTVSAGDAFLTSTENHPFMSFPTWKVADDLQGGDWVYRLVSPPPVEEWRAIDGWPFEVSNMGRVRRVGVGKHGLIAEFTAVRAKGVWGHVKVTLTRFQNGREKKDFPVHRLVAEAFLPSPTFPGMEVGHLNGVADCNWSTNLRWMSSAENGLQMRLHGTADNSSQAKLSWDAVDVIRSSPLTPNVLAEKFGVSLTLVQNILAFKRWTGRREPMTGFQPVKVSSVVTAGFAETYDLTVEDDHSFVANGFVVHNTSCSSPALQTLPKRGKWAKLLRTVYTAPPGKTIVQCLPAHAPVQTDVGLVPIASVKVGDNVLVDGKAYPVLVSGCTGLNREVFRVTTATGRFLDATANHEVLVLRGSALEYVPVSDLTDSDYLVQEAEGFDGGGVFTLGMGLSRHPDIAYLGGLFMGDGNAIAYPSKHYSGMHSYVLSWSLGLDSDDLLPELQKLASRFSCKVSLTKQNDARLSSKDCYCAFTELFPKTSSKNPSVPWFIFQATKEVRQAFLAGAFDSDGSAHSRRLTISSICEEYVQQLALLAASVGVFGVIRRSDRVTKFSKGVPVTCYHFDVFAKSSIEAFPPSRIKRKQAAIVGMLDKAYAQCCTERIPVKVLTPFNVKGAQSTLESNRVFSNGRWHGFTTRDSLSKGTASNPILALAGGVLRYRYDKVVSVSYLNSQDVYDIKVAEVRCFNAYGYRVHNCDYAQGELKIAACLANEKTMLQAYRDGADLHAVTGAKLSGYSYDDFLLLPDEQRDRYRSFAKPCNFGLLYAMSANGFREYARTAYSLKLTEQEAENYRNAFFDLYTGLLPWHAEYKSIAKRTGMVRTPLGRVRRLPLINSPNSEARAQAERQAINSPVQGTLSDMMQLAMVLIDREYGDMIDMFLMVHDSLAFYVDIDRAEDMALRCKAIADNLPLKAMFGWDHQIPFTVDMEISQPDDEGVYSLATLKKFKG